MNYNLQCNIDDFRYLAQVNSLASFAISCCNFSFHIIGVIYCRSDVSSLVLNIVNVIVKSRLDCKKSCLAKEMKAC